MTPVFILEAVQDYVEVFENRLTIKPVGVMGFLNKGLKGTKTIPFSSIKAIQFKEAGFNRGYLQLSIDGGLESRGGILAAASDENTFFFSKKQNSSAKEIKEFIEAQLYSPAHAREPMQRSLSRPANEVPVGSKLTGLWNELEGLQSLKERGVLSEDEFTSAKKRLVDQLS